MKRVKWLPLFMLLASGGVKAQAIIGVTVGLTQPSANFYVDGQMYSNSQTFLWPVGSKHILQFPFTVTANGTVLPFQAGNGDTVQWSFSGWTDNLGLITPSNSPVQTITVEPGLTSIIGGVSTVLELTITFPTGTGSGGSNAACSGAPDPPTAGATGWGLVYVNGACYSDSATIYVGAGTVNLNAFPYPGYGFVGFESGGNPPNPALSQITQTTPLQISVIFSPAKRVSFYTNPPDLQLIIDQTIIITPPPSPTSIQQTINSSPSCSPNNTALPPNLTTYGGSVLCTGSYDFLPGSSHRIGAPPTQQDISGLWWVFNGFSDGLGQNGIYVTNSATNVPDTVTGNFLAGMQSAILTVPAGLKISIDGTTTWDSYNFVWAQGSSHTLAAPSSQVDSSGRTWQFAGWSNGGSASQTVTVPTSGQAFVVTANYTLLGQVQVTSAPPGLTFTVGGTTCITPCAVSQASGTQVQIVAPASSPLSATARLDFVSWSNGATTPTLSTTFTQGAQVLTANYQTSYALLVSASPVNQASVKTTPASPDGFFPAGTQISVTPAPASGFKFADWGGDLSGTLSPGYLTMSGPHSVVVYLTSVPVIPPAGIINAAGPTPDGSVAPGSIISIYGNNLTTATQIGPSNPLAQTIGNVTVMVNNILMPLIFVSPGQINAQVPVELAAGSYTLTVQSLGQQPVSGTFKVSRNAPGIFTMPNPQNLPLGAALHQDGTLISMTSPARRHEIVSLYGTGLGPLSQSIVDGFPAPMAPLLPATDTVTVNAAGVNVPATWAGAAPTLVGTDIVQLQIVDAIPSATTIQLTVTSGGSTSAVVQLPVE